jgi:hypothetical protein
VGARGSGSGFGGVGGLGTWGLGALVVWSGDCVHEGFSVVKAQALKNTTQALNLTITDAKQQSDRLACRK